MQQGRMISRELINRVLDYIEDNLTQAITPDRIATVAGYSRYHFGRLFRTMTGERLAKYVRRRRLCEAARELLLSRRRILDIALDYQFGSQEAFTRAFKKEFGTSPGLYRRQGRFTKLFPRLTLREPALCYLGSRRAVSGLTLPSGADQIKIIPVRTYAVFIQQTPASVITRTFDRVLLYYG